MKSRNCKQCGILATKENTYINSGKQSINYQATCKQCKNKQVYKRSKARRKTDPDFRMKTNISILIGRSIKQKKSSACKILGCTVPEFRVWIEAKFVPGMTWDNHGEWHLDHITPVSWAKSESDFIRLNHYTNFQPLWAKDNISKGNRYSG